MLQALLLLLSVTPVLAEALPPYHAGTGDRTPPSGLERELTSQAQRLLRRATGLAPAHDEALSAADSVLGFFGGRRSSSALSRASSKRRMTQQAKLEISESEEQIEVYEKDIKELQREMQQEIEQLQARWATVAEQLDEFQVRPRRADVQIDFVGLGWRPVWRSA